MGTDWAIWIWQVLAPSISTSIRLVGGKVNILKIGRQGNNTGDQEEGKGKLDHDFGGNIGESGQRVVVFAGICKYQLIPTTGVEGGQQEMVLLQLRAQSQTPTDSPC